MGHIKKIIGKAKLKEPKGWEPKDDQFNLPFTVELKENFHVHWQDIRIEMMPKDFEDFVSALNYAYTRWKQDGKPKELPEMKRYGWWPGEEDFDFYKDRDKKLNNNKKDCHHFRKFPRTQSGKLHFDSVFQVELQEAGQYHIHYKNFRIELSKNTLEKMIKAMNG